jgi:hypothetical protein
VYNQSISGNCQHRHRPEQKRTNFDSLQPGGALAKVHHCGRRRNPILPNDGKAEGDFDTNEPTQRQDTFDAVHSQLN